MLGSIAQQKKGMLGFAQQSLAWIVFLCQKIK
jgi:hypothetical protein